MMMMMMILKQALCFVNALVTPLYLLLTVTAPLVLVLPLVRTLASHGKLRSTTSSKKDGSSTKTNTGRRRGEVAVPLYGYLQKLLESELLLMPKKYFRHFYYVGIIALLVVSALAVVGATREDEMDSSSRSRVQGNIPVLALVWTHLMRRCYECHFVHVWTHSKMHVAGYLLGLLHYSLLPFVVVTGYNDGFVCQENPGSYTYKMIQEISLHNSHVSNSLVLFLVLVCFWAQYQQHRHHQLLAQLRKTGSTGKTNNDRGSGLYNAEQEKTNARDYTLPTQGWFSRISCPHYLAEILIYICWAVLVELQWHDHHTGGMRITTATPVIELPKQLLLVLPRRHWLLFLWVLVNQCVAAMATHQWYLQNIPTYASLGRYAILPYLL